MAQAPVPLDVGALISQVGPGSIAGQRLSLYQSMLSSPAGGLPVYQPQGQTAAEVQTSSQASSDLSTAREQTGKQGELYNQANQDLINAVQAGAAAKQQEIDAAQQRSQAIADTAMSALNLFDSNSTNPDSKVSRAAALLNQKDEEMMKQAADISRVSQATLLDDPITAMFAPLLIPTMKQNYNANVQQVNTLQNVVDESVRQANNQYSMQAAAIPTITVQQAAAQKEVAAQAANIEASQAKMEAAKLNTNLYFERAKASMQQYDIAYRQGANQRDENYKAYNSKVEAARFSASQWMQRLQLADAALQLTENTQNELFRLQMIKQGMGVTGQPEEVINALTIDTAKNLPKSWADTMFQKGFTGALGADPLQAMIELQKIPGPKLPPPTVKTYQLLKNQENAVLSKLKNDPKFAAASGKEQATILQQAYGQQLKDTFKSANDKTPLAIPKPNIVLSTPAITGNDSKGNIVQVPLPKLSAASQQILKPLANSKAEVSDSQVISTLASQLLGRGATPNFARNEIMTYVNNAIAIRNQGMDFTRFAFGSDPELMGATRRYNVRGPGGGLFNPEVPYDLTNPAMVDSFILQIKRQDAFNRLESKVGAGRTFSQ